MLRVSHLSVEAALQAFLNDETGAILCAGCKKTIVHRRAGAFRRLPIVLCLGVDRARESFTTEGPALRELLEKTRVGDELVLKWSRCFTCEFEDAVRTRAAVELRDLRAVVRKLDGRVFIPGAARSRM
jgi:hypothetical protein